VKSSQAKYFFTAFKRNTIIIVKEEEEEEEEKYKIYTNKSFTARNNVQMPQPLFKRNIYLHYYLWKCAV